MEKIEISDNRSVGKNELPFIIAEIGNNHNGNLDLAKEMLKRKKNFNSSKSCVQSTVKIFEL